jgi:membrane protein EpsK
MGRLIFRLLLILLCFSIWGPKLRFIGFVDLGLNIGVVGIVVRIWRKLTPELYISFREVDRTLLSPIFKMSFWSLINQLGALLYLRTDIWIINRFISPVAAGGYAAVLVVSNFIRQLANMFSAQLSPTIMAYWAKDDRSSLTHFLAFSMKILSFGLAFPTIVICLNSETILHLWLGQEFDGLSTLLIITAIHLPINTGILPLFALNSASNTIRIPALVTFFMGIGNVALSYYLGVSLDMGAIGVALATAIVLTLKNSLFIPLYGARTLKVSSWTFVYPTLLSGLVMGLVWGFSLIPVSSFFSLGHYAESLVQTLMASAVTAIICWVVLISKSEKNTLFDMLPQKLQPRLQFFFK